MADETKSGLEELAKESVPNGAGAEGKGGESQPGAGTTQQSKGTWISVLPEDLRKGVEAEKYANLNEYVRDLQAKANGSVRDEQAFTEGWDRYVEEMKSSGMGIPEGIQGVLKESGVDADTAKKLMKAFAEHGSAELERSRNAAKEEMKGFLDTEWKGAFEQNNEILKKGIRLFGTNHPELMRKASERGSMYTPEFVQLLVDYARMSQAANKEASAPEGTPASASDSGNRFGLKNI